MVHSLPIQAQVLDVDGDPNSGASRLVRQGGHDVGPGRASVLDVSKGVLGHNLEGVDLSRQGGADLCDAGRVNHVDSVEGDDGVHSGGRAGAHGESASGSALDGHIVVEDLERVVRSRLGGELHRDGSIRSERGGNNSRWHNRDPDVGELRGSQGLDNVVGVLHDDLESDILGRGEALLGVGGHGKGDASLRIHHQRVLRRDGSRSKEGLGREGLEDGSVVGHLDRQGALKHSRAEPEGLRCARGEPDLVQAAGWVLGDNRGDRVDGGDRESARHGGQHIRQGVPGLDEEDLRLAGAQGVQAEHCGGGGVERSWVDDKGVCRGSRTVHRNSAHRELQGHHSGLGGLRGDHVLLRGKVKRPGKEGGRKGIHSNLDGQGNGSSVHEGLGSSQDVAVDVKELNVDG